MGVDRAMLDHGLDRGAGADDLARALTRRYGHLSGGALLRAMIGEAFPGRLALVSAFGAESAVLLQLVATVEPSLPVIFLDTGKHFAETLAYRDALADRLGLTDLRVVAPRAEQLARYDPDGDLHRSDPDFCCYLRKVRPLERALDGFDAWITGRKRFHGGDRGRLPAIEAVDGRVKINPLADWSRSRIAAAARAGGLPPHPLVAAGFASIGCAPCTRATRPGETVRAGRWQGQAKTECGIHRPAAE